MKLSYRLVFGLLLSLAAVASWAATLEAEVDRTEFSEQESFNLTLTLDDSSSEQPDFSPLNRDFEILSQSSSQQYRSFNGQASTEIHWQLQLLAKHAGNLELPALSVGNLSSQPIQLRVLAQTVEPHSDNNPIQIELQGPDAGWPEQPLKLSMRILLDQSCQGQTEAAPTPVTPANAKITALGSMRKFQKRISSRNLLVYEQDFMLTASQSGSLSIEPLSFKANMACPPNFNPRFYRVETKTKTIQIHDKPAGYQGWWLATPSFSISEDFAAGPYRVGEPISRKIRMVATDVMAEQLPAVPRPNLTEVKIYADPPQLNSQTDSQRLRASREESLTLIPTQAGKLHLPAIQFQFFNTQTNKAEQVELPERDIEVLPAANANHTPNAAPESVTTATQSAVNTAPVQTSNSTYGWQLVSLALLISNLVLGWLYWRERQHNNDSETQASSINTSQVGNHWLNLRQACRDHRASQAGQALRALLYHYQHQRDLLTWAQQQDPQTSRVLAELDQACGRQTAWDGAVLLALLPQLKLTLQNSNSDTAESPLNP